MGVVGAPHGIRGECRIKSFAADPLAFGAYGPLFSGDGRVFTLASSRPLKDDLLVVRFHGIADRDAVQALTGTELFIDRALLPDPDDEEFYHADLIGLSVIGLDGALLGRVFAVHEFGAGDVLEIRSVENARSWYHPFSKAGVPEIRLKDQKIVIDPAFIPSDDPEEKA